MIKNNFNFKNLIFTFKIIPEKNSNQETALDNSNNSIIDNYLPTSQTNETLNMRKNMNEEQIPELVI